MTITASVSASTVCRGGLLPFSVVNVGMFGNRRDIAIDQFLDIAQISSFLDVAETKGDAAGAGPAGTPDAVHVGFGDVRQIEVDHVAELLYVDAARGDIGSDQYAGLTVLEILQYPLAVVLGLVPVDSLGSNFVLGQDLGDLVGPVFGPAEDQCRFDLRIIEYVEQ